MSNNINESLQMTEAEQKNQFFQQGFATYFDVVRALHLFQVEVGSEIGAIFDDKTLDRMKTAMLLEEKITKHGSPAIQPRYPDPNWSYKDCQIFRSFFLHKPEYTEFYFGVEISDKMKLFCSLRARTVARLQRWHKIIKENLPKNSLVEIKPAPDRFIVLYRDITLPDKSLPDKLKSELEKLLDDFLKCFEASHSPNIPPAEE